MFKKLFAALAAISMLSVAPAMAQKVAYYDHDEVIADSKAWKALVAELKTKGDEIGAQLEPIVKQINEEGQAIGQTIGDKTPDKLSEAEKKRVAAWQQQAANIQAQQQAVGQQFNVVRELAEAKINSVIVQSLEDVAKAKKVDVLLRETSLGYVSSRFDATKEMTAAVDRRLATLSVDALIEEVQQQQAAAAAASAN